MGEESARTAAEKKALKRSSKKETPKILLEACLNGSWSRRDHKAIPITPFELALSAKEVFERRIFVVHIHPRDQYGDESLESRDCGEAIADIRKTCPLVKIGLSTGAWIEPELSARMSAIGSWNMLPDFASVNFSEEGAEQVCKLLISKGVGVEAGLSSLQDIKRFAKSGVASQCLRILIEPEVQDPDSAVSAARAMDSELNGLEILLPRRLCHGSGRATWATMKFALKKGYDIRVGFEDTLTLPRGKHARNNSELIRMAMKLIRVQGCKLERPPESAALQSATVAT